MGKNVLFSQITHFCLYFILRVIESGGSSSKDKLLLRNEMFWKYNFKGIHFSLCQLYLRLNKGSINLNLNRTDFSYKL